MTTSGVLTPDDRLYQLVVPSLPDHFRVHSFRGEERLGDAWRFDVVASGRDLGAGAGRLVGQRAAFVMRAGAPRAFSGMIAAVRVVGRDRHDGVEYRLRLVSRFWALRFRRRSRIFQDMTLEAIVSAVLKEAGIASAWRLGHAYPAREYVTQYEESDHAFVRRLLGEAGVTFRHVHPDANDAAKLAAGDSLAFGDDASFYAPIAARAALRFVAAAGTSAPAFDEVSRFESAARLRENAASYWEYDPERPEAMLTADAKSDGAEDALEYYDHHGEYHFRKWSYGREEPARILRQKRRRARLGEGASHAPALAPGLTFHLEEHPIGELNREYALARVRHEGWATTTAERQAVYQNRFECVPAEVIHTLARPAKKSALVALTATVVGPGGEEIHTDAAGRVKVRFHWDREGKDDKTSCWIRTMQGWGGQGWGGQFIPRVGMEVVVAFEGGDPDKPIVLGCLYNGTHPLPFRLPEDRTRSGIRTRSTPRAEGYNELSFEDEAGAEQIHLRAERDLVERVGHDHVTTVDHDESEVVGGSQSSRVSGSRRYETLGGEVHKTLGSSELHVGGERTELVGGGARRTVDGDEIARVGGNSLSAVRGNRNLRTDGNYAIEVGTREKPGTADWYAWGHAMFGSGMGIQLRAEQRIVLGVGESTIEIGKDEIKLSAPKLRLAAEKELSASGDGPALRLDKKAELHADEVKIYSSKASIELDEHAHIDGKMVKLACDAGDPTKVVDDTGKPTTQPLKLKLADAKYQPYGNREFVVKAGGARVEGKTGGDGSLDVAVPIEAQTAEVTLWLGKRPGGPTRRYVIELKALEPAKSPTGAQQRLRHLGYYFRTPSGELDPPTRHALADFQKDHGLQATGELDEATHAKLEDAHGH